LSSDERSREEHEIAVLEVLDDGLREQIRALVATVKARDGAPPLSDHALLQLGSSRPGLVHLVAGKVDGYAQLDDHVAEIADLAGATPALLAELEGLVARPIVWSHGKRSPVAAAATARGYIKQRVLWQLRRPLSDVPDTPLPEGVRLRAFVPGQDEDAWLAVNAAAFADHAEQGRWTRADLEAREREPWFDPSGFLLAFRDDELVGFHWTKVHRTGIGEVYVLGVAPQAQGLRLGPALLTAGLGYLIDRGVTEVMLYVDESNTAAMGMYQRYGFTPYDLDAQYVLP
jgi:mycothiol synthase